MDLSEHELYLYETVCFTVSNSSIRWSLNKSQSIKVVAKNIQSFCEADQLFVRVCSHMNSPHKNVREIEKQNENLVVLGTCQDIIHEIVTYYVTISCRTTFRQVRIEQI